MDKTDGRSFYTDVVAVANRAKSCKRKTPYLLISINDFKALQSQNFFMPMSNFSTLVWLCYAKKGI